MTDRSLPTTFFGVLELIRECPELYLKCKSLSHFKTWFKGYQLGRTQAGASPFPEDFSEFEGFNEFVRKKYRFTPDTAFWDRKILYHEPDEAAALDRFFQLLDEFKASKRKKSSSIRNTKSRRKRA